MKVAIYARVSTSDKDQDPETQLLPLREFVQAQGWECYQEYYRSRSNLRLLASSSSRLHSVR